jgi:hypothetical protein
MQCRLTAQHKKEGMKPELFGKYPSSSSTTYTSDSLSQSQHLRGEDGSNEETGIKDACIMGVHS